MYTPKAYAWDDVQEIERFVQQRGFGILVSPDLEATEVPLLWREAGGKRYLCGHLAQANPLASSLHGKPVLILFAGADGYVSPLWYETPDVPTWNYVAVHVHGTFRASDPADSWQDLADLVCRHEADSPIAQLLRERRAQAEAAAALGFRVEIERMEGKRKLSQNRSEASRAGILRGLRSQGDPASLLLAAAMAGLEAPR